jgi:plasmid stability protein
MMTLTIPNIDRDLEMALMQRSISLGVSQEEAAEIVLRDSLLEKEPYTKKQKLADLDRIFDRKWTKEENKEFEKATADFERIDPEDWK